MILHSRFVSRKDQLHSMLEREKDKLGKFLMVYPPPRLLLFCAFS